MGLLLALTLLSAAPKDPWFSQDKPIHATISFTTPFAVNDMLVRVCKLDHTKSTAIALGLTAAACIGKEWLDCRKGGTGWSWKDLSYDAAGLLGAGTIMIVWKR
jgi:putative lipoprotein